MESTDATIVSLFLRRAAADAGGIALWVRRGDALAACRWAELADDVRRTAGALEKLGVTPHDRVILISPNRYEWIISDLAIQLAGAVHVPVHVSLSGAQMAYQIADSGARLVLLAGADQAALLAAHLARQSDAFRDVQFVSFDPCPAIGPAEVRRLADVASEVDRATAARIEERAVSQTRPADLATILYTSGTTGEPKGVMLSQQNLASNALGTLEAFGQKADDLRLTWLPLSHIFARTCDLYTWIASGSQLALADSPEAVIANCGELHPTLLNGVPYFFEKVQRWLVQQGLDRQPGSLLGLFGGRLRAGCAGGAPLPEHVARFYESQGVLLAQGYGLTESSPVISTETDSARKLGTVGRPIPGVEVRISPEGEILTRGPHVMLGYWNKPSATAQAIRDGWLYTGDLGELDSDGFLRITGRKKELIVTSGGKNIAPTYIEALLTSDPLIEQAVVVGDGRSCLAALIVPNQPALQPELDRLGLGECDAAEGLADPRVRAIYAQCIEQRLSDVSHYEQVRRFALLDRPFSVDRGELTLTLKLRRGVIQSNHADTIEALYQGPDA